MRGFNSAISAMSWLLLVTPCSCFSAKSTAVVVTETPPETQGVPPKVVEAPRPESTFVYAVGNRRDPFRSYLTELAEQRTGSHAERRREETEQYELSDYRLTGLITGISQPKAMVEDPAGRGHVIHLGTRLGKNGGKVSTIAPHGLQIVEDTVDTLGKHARLKIDIPLPHLDIEDASQK